MQDVPEFNATLHIDTDNELAMDFVNSWLDSYAVDIRAGLRSMGFADDEVVIEVSDNGGVLVRF